MKRFPISGVRWRLTFLRKAHEASRAAARTGAQGYFEALRTTYRLHRRHGFQPDEAARLGLVASPADAERRFISKSRLVARQRVLNPPSFQELTEDKALFYTFCTRAGLPVPPLLGILLTDGASVAWPDRPLTGPDSWPRFFDDCPEEFVVKPSRGVYGEGIRFVDKRDPQYSSAALARSLQDDARYRSFVVQACMENHPDLLALNPVRGLQTVRVITFVRETGDADILMAYLKPIGGTNRVDNHNSGRTGNFLCRVDLATGRLGAIVAVTDAGVRTLPALPSGKTLDGEVLPLWPQVADLARRLALAFVPMRCIGWDIGITPAGPVCIEGNARWDPPKFGDVAPLSPVTTR